MVSAFSHDRGEILGIKVIENKKESEINVVQDLLVLLDLKNVVLSMDALHCQKKLSPPLSIVSIYHLFVCSRVNIFAPTTN
jgi:predicted transposase YbfD/YdcC